MADFHIRPLIAGDIEALVCLAHEIWHAHYPGIIGPEQIDFMLGQRYAPDVIRDSLNGSCWLAAWKNNQMLGFAHGMANDAPGVWKLDKLYVHPRHQRKGVGKALLEGVIEHAARAKAGKLVLRVNRDNSAALAAYARYGFRVYGEDVLNIGHGFVMDDYLMELDVS